MKERIKTNHWIICAIFAVVIAGWPGRAFAQETPVTNLVTLTTFDYDFESGIAHNLRWNYGYKYDWGGTAPVYTYLFLTAYYEPDDTSFTNAMGQFNFDNTGYGEFMTNYPGGGYGFGFGGGLNWTNDSSIFTATNREDYILSFRARAEGLKAGVASTSGEFQMQFATPDNTIQPEDANTDDDMLMQVNLNFSVSSNWQNYVFTLDQGTIADGKTEADFILYRLQGCNPRFNINIHQPEGGWDFDADNNLYVDNIRLEVVQKAPPPPPPPMVPLAIFDFNFDDKPLWWSWTAFPGGTGWSANANRAAYWVDYPAAGAGVDGSQAYIMAMDNSTIATDPPGVPQWAGGNTGGGGPVNYTLLTSPDLKDYQVVLDARVAGLAEGQTSTPLTAQIHFRAPDDTIQPSDTDTNNDVIVVMNLGFQGINTNWQSLALLLKSGSAQSGSTANFSSYFDKINSIDFQFQINNSANTTLWGTDADNQVVIDNFRLERFVVATPPLAIQTLGNNVVVSWAAPDTGTVKLLSGDTLTTVTTEIVGATSPHTNAISGDMKYFRTQWVAP